MFKRIVWILLLVVSTPAFSQVPALERYIEIGLSENLALKQQEFSLEQSLETLNEAKGMFMPSIGIEARYSRAGGGRIIEFPVGDLMNPVYSTLNQLLEAQGLPPRPFPTLRNEIIPFLREEEQDTKLRLVQPIFQPAIYYNYKVKSSLHRAREAGRDAYRRRLVADIKTGYFNYLKAVRVAELLDETRGLLEENLRVSEKLVENGKATRDVIYRAMAELSELDQSRAEAARDMTLAASYFNFLLNRPLDGGIELPGGEMPPASPGLSLEEAERTAIGGREELAQLRFGMAAAAHGVRLASTRFMPSVNLVLDYGIQGEGYRFSDEDDYWMGSLLLEWNIFNGFQKKSQRDRAALEKKRLEAGLVEVEKRIRLQVREAYDNLEVARKAIESARGRARSARQSFNIIRRKYEEGMSPQVEFLDARTNLTNAQIGGIIAGYDLHVRLAEFEWATARYGLRR